MIEQFLAALPKAWPLPRVDDSTTIVWNNGVSASTLTFTPHHVVANLETLDFHGFLRHEQVNYQSMWILFEMLREETDVDAEAMYRILDGLPVQV